ncbi:HAD family hydrolase [Nocardia sp. alder85J]|uniref:HAD family hydrolase n=1 Tax=Nocardia sp. alder85J TaxID=2862949 RepID=UPI001CD60FCC|nr:HAD family hydrolase [Nocardia sp. alder85J]MCX4091255.1 HAD hydrolase-like protein [Nocardia sp. alder85J]
MTIEAVLFDFSGTLYRLEPDETWTEDLVSDSGEPFPPQQSAELLRHLTHPTQTLRFDARAQYAWDHRDLDPALHEQAYREVLRQSGVTGPQAGRLYSRLVDPLAWTPYPDTGAVLKHLDTQRIPAVVVSNIAFDLRPALTAHGWERYIAAFALSFEIGSMKPDRGIFDWTFDRLGVAPESVLMVGDSPENDGVATEFGCKFALVDPLPTGERRDALTQALRAHGVG